MNFIYLKSALKCDSFDVGIGIKIPFFRVLVTIEPGRSLLQFVTTNCLITAGERRKKPLKLAVTKTYVKSRVSVCIHRFLCIKILAKLIKHLTWKFVQNSFGSLRI